MTTTEFSDPLTESEFDDLRRQLDRLICQQEDIGTPEAQNRAEALAKADLTVEVIADLARLPKHRTRVSIQCGQYVVICDICNAVGRPEDLEGDAEAIAARHQEIGGFG